MKFKIVIIGFGSIGKKHLKALISLNGNFRIFILTSQKITKLPKGVERNLTNINEIFSINPNIALISSPATTHIKYANLLIEKNINLFIEKPIANKVDKSLLSLINKYKKKNSPIMLIGYQLRFNNSLKFLKNQLGRKKIGNIISVRCEVGQNLKDWRSTVHYSKSVSAKKSLGGGVLRELSHDIDYIIWLFGKIKWIKSSIYKKSKLNIDVEDTVFLNLGAYSGNKDTLVNLNMDFTRHDKIRQCIIIGEKGTLKWNGFANRVDIFSEKIKKWKMIYKSNQTILEMYKDEWKYIFNLIKNKNIYFNNPIDSLHVLEVIEAAEKSNSRKGLEIKIK